MTHLVLVVEDDEDIREIVCEVLDARGYDVVAARSARLALSILEAGLRPALILLDLRMAGFDGIDFRRAQLADAALQPIPVIVMTANADLLHRNPDLPWAAVIHKPLDVESLVRRVAATLADD